MTQHQHHSVASPNPRVEEREATGRLEGEPKATEVRPAAAVKASPLKSKKKAPRKRPRPQG
jgi:hypothetical protein